MTETMAAEPRPATAAPGLLARLYGYLAMLFPIGVLGQVYLAGVGAFGDLKGSGSFDPHEALGNALGIAAVVLFLLALAARRGRATVLLTLLLALLTEAAQHGLAQAGHDSRWVGGLHAFDGMVILGLGVWLAVRARQPRRR